MKVYIASPYTIGDVAMNVRKAILVAEEVRAMGHLPFVPLLAHFWHLISPHPHDYWMDMDFGWLRECDAILRLPGESKGADLEVEFARDRGISVLHSIEQLC